MVYCVIILKKILPFAGSMALWFIAGICAGLVCKRRYKRQLRKERGRMVWLMGKQLNKHKREE